MQNGAKKRTMNKDDYKALKDSLCRHNPAYDEKQQIEIQMIEQLQKELQRIKHISGKENDE